MLSSSLIDNFLLTMNDPHKGYHVLQRFTKETLESLPIKILRIAVGPISHCKKKEMEVILEIHTISVTVFFSRILMMRTLQSM